MIKLYHSPFSPNARRARMAARLTNTPVEEIAVDLQAGANRKPEYLALNPMGKVPTLVDGDFVLWESNAIAQYLAARAQNTDLWPVEPRAQAEVSRWQCWAMVHFSPVAATIVFERVLKPMMGRGTPDEARVAEANKEFQRFAGVLDGWLATRPYVTGARLSLGDLAIAPALGFAEPAKMDLEAHAHVRSWLDRIRALDAWKQTAPPIG